MTVMATEQLELDLAPLVTPETTPGASIGEQYTAWITANPWVLRAVETLVDKRLSRGYTRVGIKEVWGVLRWEYGNRFTPATQHQPFRANNNYTSRIARDLIDRRPDLAPVIKTSALRAD